MTNQFWFRPKTYGYGATPVTWEGWAITIGCALVVVGDVIVMKVHRQSFVEWLTSIAVIAGATVALVLVSVKKTDGAWGWNAGAKKIAGKSE